MARRHVPDLRLLCERCGYHLKGLKRADVCPECGKPVVESLPEKRVGSAWQQEPSPAGFVKVLFRLIVTPRAFWDRVSTRPVWNKVLLVTACLAAPIVPAIPLALLALLTSDPKFGPLVEAGDIAAASLELGGLFLLMSWIETIGLRVVSRRRGWRLSRTIAPIIVAHSAVSWIIAAGLILVGLALAYFFLDDVDYWGIPIGVGLIGGIVVFECFVYIGMQRMKYANPPGSERELAGEGDAPSG